MSMQGKWDLGPGLNEKLPSDDEFKERVWQRMITECPELEHAVLKWPDPPWWSRLWSWIRRKVRP